MCGITGFWQPPGENDLELAGLVRKMARTLYHRGPDDAGEWTDARAGVAFGFRRLSIVELSPLGHQPMISASGRYTVVFNGEIYNFQELRLELTAKGHTFRGGSDTEVILAGCDAWVSVPLSPA
jgi:asparagine synthase (glutamine-hydrolysing)